MKYARILVYKTLVVRHHLNKQGVVQGQIGNGRQQPAIT